LLYFTRFTSIFVYDDDDDDDDVLAFVWGADRKHETGITSGASYPFGRLE